MKKFLKSLVTLSLVGSVLTTNVSVFASEEGEATETEEVATEESVEEGSADEGTEEAPAEGEEVPAEGLEDGPFEVEEVGTPVENTEEVLAFIQEANVTPVSQRNTGLFQINFGREETSAPLFVLDYILTYNIEPRLSAEIDLMFLTPQSAEPSQLFAYIHNGQLLEYRDETWYGDDISELEQTFTDMLSNANGADSEVDLRAKYMDVLEDDTYYYLTLQEDINTEELWNDLNTVYDIENIKNSLIDMVDAQAQVQGVEIDQSQLDVIETFFSLENFQAAMEDEPTVQQIFDKETGYVLSNYVSLNIPVTEIYNILGLGEESAPDTMNVFLDSNHSNHGTEFDFTFLDEVAPAE